jgi:hypothetical protein
VNRNKTLAVLKALFDGKRIEDKDHIEYVIAVPTIAVDNIPRFCLIAYKTVPGKLSETVFIETGCSINEFLDLCDSFLIRKDKD